MYSALTVKDLYVFYLTFFSFIGREEYRPVTEKNSVCFLVHNFKPRVPPTPTHVGSEN